MKSKKGPILFILILICTLIFILGVQYGKSIKVTDEVIKILVSITPKAEVSKTPEQQEKYKKYQSKYCGYSFVYPTILEMIESASDSSELKSSAGKVILSINCDKIANNIFSENHQKEATRSLSLDSKEIVGYLSQKNDLSSVSFQIKNPNNRLYLTGFVDSEFLPLIENTFKFER